MKPDERDSNHSRTIERRCNFHSGCLLAIEVDKLPLLTSEETQITCERYKVDTKHVLNTKKKPWSLHRLETSLPVSDAPSGRNLHFTEIDNKKNEYNFETVRVRQEMCIQC
jgi:hypothetical protein